MGKKKKSSKIDFQLIKDIIVSLAGVSDIIYVIWSIFKG